MKAPDVHVTCPACGADLPVAIDMRSSRRGSDLTVCISASSWADVYAHIWTHEEKP